MLLESLHGREKNGNRTWTKENETRVVLEKRFSSSAKVTATIYE